MCLVNKRRWRSRIVKGRPTIFLTFSEFFSPPLTAKRASPTDSNSENPTMERNTGTKRREHTWAFLSEVSEVRVDVMLRATQARFKCGYERILAYLHQTR